MGSIKLGALYIDYIPGYLKWHFNRNFIIQYFTSLIQLIIFEILQLGSHKNVSTKKSETLNAVLCFKIQFWFLTPLTVSLDP